MHQSSRRRFLRRALAGPLCLGVGNVIQRAMGAESATDQVQSEGAAIFINLRGGLSHIDSFDPKPDAPAEIRGEFSPIATSTPGVRFGEQTPKLAACFDKFAVVRSFSHTVSAHSLAQHYVLAGDQFTKAPAIGAVVVDQTGWRVPPVYVAIPKMQPNAGLLGPNCDPYNLLGDGGELLRSSPDPLNKAASTDLQRRIGLLDSIDGRFTRGGLQSHALDVRRTAYRQSIELMTSVELRHAVNLDLEPARIRDTYGNDAWSEQLLLARRLIQAGSRFVAVTFDDRGGFGSWDTHRDNFKDLKILLPRLDHALSVLLDDLHQTGMLASTQVVVLGEMGRTPQVNANSGRDHWPKAMSMLWAGGGVRGGNAIGTTDEHGAAPVDNHVSPQDIAFTILTLMGIDPTVVTLPPSGRRILPRGQLVQGVT